MTPQLEFEILIMKIIIFVIVCIGGGFICLDAIWDQCPKFRKFIKRKIRNIKATYHAAINEDD